MIRLAFFFSALSLAAVMDIRTRTIPDWLVVLVALTSVLPPGTPNFLGVLAGLPLLLAGITIGGIGGGDVKLMGVCGLVLGASQALTGLFLALCLLVLWHAAGGIDVYKRQILFHAARDVYLGTKAYPAVGADRQGIDTG